MSWSTRHTVAPIPFLSLPNNWSFRTFLTLTKKFLQSWSACQVKLCVKFQARTHFWPGWQDLKIRSYLFFKGYPPFLWYNIKNAAGAPYFSSTAFKLNAASRTKIFSCIQAVRTPEQLWSLGRITACLYTQRWASHLQNLLFHVHVMFANIHFMGASWFSHAIPRCPSTGDRKRPFSRKYLPSDKAGGSFPRAHKDSTSPDEQWCCQDSARGFLSATAQTAVKASLKRGFFGLKRLGANRAQR